MCVCVYCMYIRCMPSSLRPRPPPSRCTCPFYYTVDINNSLFCRGNNNKSGCYFNHNRIIIVANIRFDEISFDVFSFSAFVNTTCYSRAKGSAG